MRKDKTIDALLVKQYLSGNANALTELVKRWHKSFCEKAYWLVKDADVAKDIAQDCWKTIIDKIDSLQDPESFGAWSLRIVYIKSVDRLNANKRIRESLEDYKYEQETIIDIDDRDESLKKTLLKAIKQLPEHQQTVIQLFYIYDYSLKDISAALNISVGTAKSRLFHAREKLKEKLKERLKR
ncbi:RNA polymerase sigma factor [Flavivirga spongiicola]|uniref:RNA polymerase sigma factor n=1 Tax=Flavivirga spongiicola TaxID=421621 RepID=A0ABU7XLL6_9FLAO|nr:RNA polymerase sigma factor [Flavivirga sp. MEBiC05379]MDO5981316.1 RNA polymerase sigma factor [Flavivirga sp. MEBiC05379]